MTIKLAYLYYDLMNLYGERGNVIVLKQNLENHGINVEEYQLSINDDIDFNYYDVYIIGSGTEKEQEKVLKHLMTKKEDVKKAIEDGKFFLCTGNAIELFGQSIKDLDGKMIECLGMFDYRAKRVSRRIVSAVAFNCPLINKIVIGFQNQGSCLSDYDYNLFEVMRGIGARNGVKKEGIVYNNFYGTYVIGPLLARNPYFLEYMVKKIISSKDSSVAIDDYNFDLNLDKKAYNHFIKAYYPSYK